MQGKQAPRQGDTLSEICDDDQKTAIFNHSIKGGLFKNISNSPLRERMPSNLKIY